MYRPLFAAILVVLVSAPLAAQEAPPPRFEVGLVGNGGTTPGASDLTFTPTPNTVGLYADLFVTDRLVVSPSVMGLIWGDDGFHAGHFRTDVRYLFRGSDEISPYVFGSGTAFLRRENEFVDARQELALGGGVGVRVPIGDHFAVSLEVRYDHWLDTGADQLGLSLRIGIPLGGR